MAVYAGTDPGEPQSALHSICAQTLLPDEVVVVEDGPLTAEHDAVLSSFATHAPALRRIALARQLGLGVALQAGLLAAQNAWVARMDADDIAVSTRFERQVATAKTQEFDVIGSAVLEFDGSPRNVTGLRRMPRDHTAIVRYARINNPVNHPTAFIRRAAAIRAGGYRDAGKFEDYDLFVRMLLGGARMYNHPEALVLMRAGDALLGRRRGWQNIRDDVALQRAFVRYGHISRSRFACNVILRSGFRLLPIPILRNVYRWLLSSGGRWSDATPLSISDGPHRATRHR